MGGETGDSWLEYTTVHLRDHASTRRKVESCPLPTNYGLGAHMRTPKIIREVGLALAL